MRDRQAVLSLLKGNHSAKQVVLGTVSGVVTTKTALIEHVDRNLQAVGLITTKSFQVEPNSGNREPIITEPEIGSFGGDGSARDRTAACTHRASCPAERVSLGFDPAGFHQSGQGLR